LVKNADIKESLEDDIKPKSKRNIKKVLNRDLIDSESFEDFNKYDINIEEIVMPVITKEPESVIPLELSVKTIETGQLTEDVVKVLLDEQYERIAIMVNEKMNDYNYRMYNSFKAEFRRWYEGYYDRLNKR